MCVKGPQSVPDYSLGMHYIGIVLMAYEKMLTYETLKVAYDYRCGPFFNPQLHF